MPKPRRATLVLTALLGGAAWLSWTGPHGNHANGAAAEMRQAAARDSVALPQPREVYFFSDARATSVVVPALPLRRAPVSLGANDAAVIAEQMLLQTMPGAAELELSARQWSALAEVTLHLQAVRLAYEASLARVERSEGGGHRIEIPTYPAAGDALRERLHAEIRARFSTDTANEILAALGRGLEGHFAGFGVGVQTLEVAVAANQDPRDMQVTRTISFWNSIENENRLTLRRETHFPEHEDPEGQLWGPLLALAGRVGG
jgi:hypothetical protein